jgi:beta-phosphoglucomutase-like phosphatase (HAD superfamily)
MIKRLVVFDFDGTLINSPLAGEGKEQWSEFYGIQYPYSGWWSKSESLDLNVFDIKPFEKILNIFKSEQLNNTTEVIIMTSRIYKLEYEIKNVLKINNISVNILDTLKTTSDKGERLLKHVENYPDLKEIVVYDDMVKNIISFRDVKDRLPNNIDLSLYLCTEGESDLIS